MRVFPSGYVPSLDEWNALTNDWGTVMSTIQQLTTDMAALDTNISTLTANVAALTTATNSLLAFVQGLAANGMLTADQQAQINALDADIQQASTNVGNAASAVSTEAGAMTAATPMPATPDQPTDQPTS